MQRQWYFQLLIETSEVNYGRENNFEEALDISKTLLEASERETLRLRTLKTNLLK